MFFKKFSCTSPFPKVKIVAVARDEAAYFPEWIFHHFYIGVDEIDIYINRTSDNSVSMLDAIIQYYPKVNIIDANWIDQLSSGQSKNMQPEIYQMAYKQALKDNSTDYILFIDIDEYWSHKDLNVKIKDTIARNSEADIISFGWLNQFGNNQCFDKLGQEVTGKLHCLVKSLVKVSRNVGRIRVHRPELKKGSSILVDGTPFESDENGDERLSVNLQKVRSCMIIHRLFRSPMEYVSLLNRGRPSLPEQIKLNRNGYNLSVGKDCRFLFESNSFRRYDRLKKKFLETPTVCREMELAREFVRERYALTLSNIISTPPQYFSDLIRVFTGCEQSDYEKALSFVMNSSYTHTTTDVEWLVKLASHVEIHDKSEAAYQLWRRAMALRPNGPRIVKKVNEYE